MLRLPSSLLLLPLVLACSSESNEETNPTGERTSSRDSRYCEVIPLFIDGTEVNADVYNTAEFNDCPQAEWDQLEADTIQQDLGADMVLLNGPRYFIMDAAEANIDPNAPVETFGTLQMRRLATFTLDVSEANETPYAERTINRDTEFTSSAAPPSSSSRRTTAKST